MSAIKPPFAVLWDLDGTLVDSEPYWIAAEQKIADAHESSWNHQDGLELVGKSLYDSCAIIKAKLNSDFSVDEIIDFLTDEVLAHMQREIFWRPGARELLAELKANGIKTALVTMSMRRMALSVTENLDFEAFDVIVAGDDVQFGKPHPEPYLKAAELLGVAAEHCVALEDSETGLTSAEAAGTMAIGIPAILDLNPKPNRIIWPTLSGISVTDLQNLFEGNQ